MAYYLVWFEGRTTSVVVDASTREQAIRKARAKKVAGNDKPVTAARVANESERSQIAKGTWIRTRPNGDSPSESNMKSKYRPWL